jgi:HPt (histidine-containing phosphotransfer) domain-containing protein
MNTICYIEEAPAAVETWQRAQDESYEPTFRRPAEPETLIRTEALTEYIGDDPVFHRQVFDLCLDALGQTLPTLRRVMEGGDRVAVQKITHSMRGSLGMLGVPRLQQIGEAIEHHYDDLGAERWRQCCAQFQALLEQAQRELRVRLAA